MIIKFKIFEESKYEFKIGEYAICPLGKFKVVDITDNTLWVENEYGNIAEFLKKDFIPEIDYNIKKFNV